ncbi:hypothetical protein PQX77_002503 [Marasmius sp. AFHP31]|nr:hypothetical protein PQX77_002503 [Marasmius sp. AFHP31]
MDTKNMLLERIADLERENQHYREFEAHLERAYAHGTNFQSQLDVLRREQEEVQRQHEKHVQELDQEIANLADKLRITKELLQQAEDRNVSQEREILIQNTLFRNQVSCVQRPCIPWWYALLHASFKTEIEISNSRLSEQSERDKNVLYLRHEEEIAKLKEEQREEQMQRDERVEAEVRYQSLGSS